MVNQPASPTGDPHDLLSETRDLARRVRRTQRGAWFPMLVFAAVTLVAIPFDRYGDHPRHCASTHGGGIVCLVGWPIYSSLALWYWPIALLAAYAGIGWFYLHRSHARGVGSRVPPYVVVGAVLVVLITAGTLWVNAHPAFLVENLHLPSSQPKSMLARMATPSGAIGLALLLLARIERSSLLFALTVVYLVATVATVGVGWFTHPSVWAFLPHLLLEGGMLLIGGVILAAAQRERGRSTA